MGNMCAKKKDSFGEAPAKGPRYVNVAEFFAVSIFVSEMCGKIIRELHESGVLQQEENQMEHTKHVIIASRRIQKIIDECLRHMYPTLRIQRVAHAYAPGTTENEDSNWVAPVAPDSLTTAVLKALNRLVNTNFLNEAQDMRRDWI